MCDICGGVFSHHPRCPYYSPTGSIYCEVCDEPIEEGQEYIKNADNEYIHSDCYWHTNDLVEFLGGEMGEMEYE